MNEVPYVQLQWRGTKKEPIQLFETWTNNLIMRDGYLQKTVAFIPLTNSSISVLAVPNSFEATKESVP